MLQWVGLAKSVTEKNNRRVDSGEAAKKTVQAQRNEGRGFLAAGDCLAELPVIYLQAKPDFLVLITLYWHTLQKYASRRITANVSFRFF